MKKFYKSPLMILAVGLLVIGASSVGATRAAMTYQQLDKLEFGTASIGVQAIGDISGNQLTFPAIEQEIKEKEANDQKGTIELGKIYEENVSIFNNSNTETGYSEYVRVVVRKTWKNAEGEKDMTLDPRLINVTVAEGWMKDDVESTWEQEVYYLKSPLACGDTVPFITGVKIDGSVATVVNRTGTETTIVNEYVYNDQYANISLQVDAVQTNNAVDARYGAWGVKVTTDKPDEGNIISINQ